MFNRSGLSNFFFSSIDLLIGGNRVNLMLFHYTSCQRSQLLSWLPQTSLHGFWHYEIASGCNNNCSFQQKNDRYTQRTFCVTFIWIHLHGFILQSQSQKDSPGWIQKLLKTIQPHWSRRWNGTTLTFWAEILTTLYATNTVFIWDMGDPTVLML